MAELAGFDEFYAGAYRRVVGQVFALLGDLAEAEDATQEAFAKASLHWGRIAAYDQPEAWVRRVAFNHAYNSTRRARRWLKAMARHGPPAHVPPCPPPGSTCTTPSGGLPRVTARSWSSTMSPSSRWTRSPGSCGCRSGP